MDQIIFCAIQNKLIEIYSTFFSQLFLYNLHYQQQKITNKYYILRNSVAMDQVHPRKKIKGITVSNHQILPKKNEQKIVKPILAQNTIRNNNPHLLIPNRYHSTSYTQNSKTYNESTSTQVPQNRDFNISYFEKESNHFNYQIQPYKTVSFPSYASQRDSKSPIIYNQSRKSPRNEIQHKNLSNYSQYIPPSASVYKTEPMRNGSVQATYSNGKFISDFRDPYRYRSITKVQSINQLEPLEFVRDDRRNSANKSIQLGYYKRQSLDNSKHKYQRSLQRSYEATTNRQLLNDTVSKNMQIIKEQKPSSNSKEYDRSRLKFYKSTPQEQLNYHRNDQVKNSQSESLKPQHSRIPSETEKILKQIQQKIQQSRNSEQFKISEPRSYYKSVQNELEHSRQKNFPNKNLEDSYLKSYYSIEKQKSVKDQKITIALQEKIKEKDQFISKQNIKIQQLTKNLQQYSEKISNQEKQLFKAKAQAGGDHKRLVAELRNRITTLQKENSSIIITLNEQKSMKKSLQNQHYSCQRNKLVYEEQLQLMKKQLAEKQKQIYNLTNQFEMKIHHLQIQLTKQKQLHYILQNSVEKKREEQSSQSMDLVYYKEVISKLVNQKDQLVYQLENSKHEVQQEMQKSKTDDVSLSLENKSLKQQNEFIKQQLIKAKNSLTENIALKKQLANIKQDMSHLKLILTQTQSEYSKCQKQTEHYQTQFNSSKKEVQRLQNENNDLRLNSYQITKQNGQKWLQMQSENNTLKTQLEFLKNKQTQQNQLRNTNSYNGNQNGLSPTNKSKLESEVLYLKRKNQDLTKEIINVNEKMRTMAESYQQNLRSLSPTKITKVSPNFTLEQMKTKFESYQNKSLELSRRLHAKQNNEDMLRDRISQLQTEKRQLKDKLQLIEKKGKSLQDSKRYSTEFSKYQLQQLNDKFQKTVTELNESLKRKNRDILQKDNFITSFLLSKVKPQSEVARVIEQIKQYFSQA